VIHAISMVRGGCGQCQGRHSTDPPTRTGPPTMATGRRAVMYSQVSVIIPAYGTRELAVRAARPLPRAI